MRRAQIIGTGLYAPEKVVPNSYFDDYYGEDVDTFLRTKRNIVQRRYAAEGEMPSDLAVEAARAAMDAAGIGPDAIDLLIVSTDTPDYLSPSTAAVVQHKLGLRDAGTFDLNTACAGFVTALDVGSKYVAADPQYAHVLVVGVYLMSRFIDFRHRNTATLFADGAGAVVLRPTDDDHGVLTTYLDTQGQYHDYMGIYNGAAGQPCTPGIVDRQEHLLQFRAKFPKTFNRDEWSRVARLLADRLGATPADVDHYFFTQINITSIWETLDELAVPYERAHNVMDRYGYTGSACVPMALADAAAQHKLKRGDLVFCIASGGGAAIAGAALRWGYDS